MSYLDPIGAAPVPEFGRIPDASRHFGLSRTRIYELAAAGLIRVVRDGKTSSLVDFASVRSYLASRPLADIRLPGSAPKHAA